MGHATWGRYALWYVPAAVRGSLITSGIAAATLVALSGCGGSNERQDADEPRGTFNVAVDASFPAKQSLAKKERLDVRVRNTGDKTIPNVSLTVDGFSYRSNRPELADPNRPNWIVDKAPRGGDTAYTGTWALGRLKPGEERTFTYGVTPVRPGTHRVKYRVAAGLDGKAKAQLDGGGIPQGSLTATVSREPGQSAVDPNTGEVRGRSNDAKPGGTGSDPGRDSDTGIGTGFNSG